MAKTFTGESISVQNTRKDKVSNGTLTGNYYQDLDNQILECVSNPTLVTCGKNLFDLNSFVTDISVMRGTCEVLNDGFKLTAIENDAHTTNHVTSGVANDYVRQRLFPVDDTKNFRLSLTKTKGQCIIYISYVDANYNYIRLSSNVLGVYELNVLRTFPVPQGARWVTIRYGVSVAGESISFTNIQVELGSVATPYEPYIGYQNNYIVDLRKVGEVSDTLDLVTGKVTKRIGEVILNGSESWNVLTGVGGNYFQTANLIQDMFQDNVLGRQLCDKLPIKNPYQYPTEDALWCLWQSGSRIRISKQGVSSVIELKNWLQANPVKVYYELATPEEYYIDVNPLYSLNNYTHYSQTQSVKGNMSLDLSLDLGFYSEETTANMILELDGIDISDCVIDSYTETWESEVSDEFRIGCFPSKEVKLGLDMNKVRDKYETSPDLEKPLTLKWNVSYKSEGEDLTEVIDGGTFLLDDLEEEYNGFAKATLYDRAILTDVPYDFTKLDYETGTTTVAQVQEICAHLNLELEGEEYIYNKPVKWYDNMMSVRSHLIYIAELSACNLYMTRDNKLRFSPVRPDYPQVTLPLEYVTDEFEEGDEVTFTRVLWNNGLVEYVVGNNDGSTLYVSSNNPYVDSADDIEHIYSNIQGLKVSNIKTMKSFGNPLMNVFDVIEFTDNGAHYGYTLVNSMNTSFSQAFMQKLSASVQNENYERTAKYFGDPSIRRIQIEVDQNKGTIDMVVTQVDHVIYGNPSIPTDTGIIGHLEKLDELSQTGVDAKTELEAMASDNLLTPSEQEHFKAIVNTTYTSKYDAMVELTEIYNVTVDGKPVFDIGRLTTSYTKMNTFVSNYCNSPSSVVRLPDLEQDRIETLLNTFESEYQRLFSLAQNISNGNYEDLKSGFENFTTQYTQDKEGFNWSIEQIKNDYGGTVDNVNKYMRFGLLSDNVTTGLEISTESKEFATVITEKQLEFRENQTPRAWINNRGMNFPTGVVSDSLSLGNVTIKSIPGKGIRFMK